MKNIYTIKPERKQNITGWYVKFIAILSLIMAFALDSQAQTETLSFSFDNERIETIIKEIRRQSDINFIYNDEELRKTSPISISVTNESLDIIIKKLASATGLNFESLNGTIVISPLQDVEEKSEIPEEKFDQKIRGKVIDKDSKAPLPFATVYVKNSNPVKGASTDIDGIFEIKNLPRGRITLVADFVGYGKIELPEIQIGTGREAFVTLELREQIESLGEVVITNAKGEPLNDMATVSAISFNAEETKRYPASISDPARMAQVFPGVATTDDASNEIVIRGNSPNWLLWRLEGIEIPNPNHFAEEGFTAGAVSILSTNTLGSSDFYTGAFSGEYGNALSGVFDINLRKGNNQKREYSFQAGFLGLAFSAEGPFQQGKKASYLINYRYSTLSILNQIGVSVSENTLPNYQDLSFKVSLPSEKFGTFELWGIGGMSDSDEKYFPDTALGEKFEYGYTDLTKTGMYATGLSHTYPINNRSYIRSVISPSLSASKNDVEQMDSLGVMKDNYNDQFSRNALRFSSYYNNKISQKLTVRTGIILNNLKYDFEINQFTDSTQQWRTSVNSKGETNLYQAYAQSKYRLSDRLLLTTGLHFSHFELSKENVIEPRLGLVWSLAGQQKISFGYGMHSRHESLPIYFVEFQDSNGNISQPNKSIGLTKATHYVLGYEKKLAESLNFKLEAYYQQIQDLPIPNNPEKYMSPSFGGVNPNDTLVGEGKGRNYGLELTIQKFFTNDYYFMISGSLFESKYQTKNGKWYNSPYNLNYIFNTVGGKEIAWGENRMIGLNGKINWTGGKRITPIDLEQSIIKDEAVYKMDDIYAQKASDYFRVDVGVKLHFYRSKSEHILALDIQNVTNRSNQWYEVYDKEKKEIVVYPMAGLIPILSYKIEF